MFILKYKKIFFSLSAVLVLASLIAIFTVGLKPGIDFTGGSLLEFEYLDTAPEQSQIEEVLNDLELGQYLLRGTEESGFILQTQTIDDAIKKQILESVSLGNEVEEKRFNTVGPTLGKELKSKSIVALLVVIMAIILFIAYTFRHVSKPVASFKYGLVAIIALAHDVIITLGFFVLLGVTMGTEIDSLFVTALLVILGYSINDTIVVLDRIRENLKDQKDSVKVQKFEEFVGKGLKDTIGRSINTSITTLLALFAIYFFAGPATHDFSLALIVGVIVGSYSSIFLAAPLLLLMKDKKVQVKDSE